MSADPRGGVLRQLVACVREMRDGDLLLFTDWRGDPDQLLDGAGPATVSGLLCAAARRGVQVRACCGAPIWT